MQKVFFRKIGVKSYKPGKSILLNRKKVIKLSANESALGFSPLIKRKISKIKYDYKTAYDARRPFFSS